jgi:glycosyltransferase involved in cell wall biosynthesis
LKILFLISSLSSGGAERVAATLCNAWAQRGDEVTLVPTFSGGGKPFYQLHPDIDLIYLSERVGVVQGGGKRYGARLRALRHMVKEKKPDVVVSFLPNVNIAALAATAFTGVPCIVCERSDPSIQPVGWVWKMACQWFYRHADWVTVQTEAVQASIHHVYGGLERVAVVPNPLPMDVLGWQANHLEQENTGRKTLLSLGRLSEEKQVSSIIQVFAQLAPKFPDWDLAIYGEGPQRAKLEAQIVRLGLAQRVFLRGRTHAPWRVMSEADAFVMASRFEGFPNALLEAMGVGLPCVSTDCPSGPCEMSRGGIDALLVGVHDRDALRSALAQLMGDAALRHNLGRHARASVIDRYALEAVLKVWDGLFAAVSRSTPTVVQA